MLVIPKRQLGSFFDLTDDERNGLMALLAEARLGTEAEFAPAGYSIGIHDGAAAGQTVPHLHIYLIPRFAGDLPDPRGGLCYQRPSRRTQQRCPRQRPGVD